MAIYSLNHKSVGRSTHKSGTAAAHAKYILRAGSDAISFGQHMPTGKYSSATFLLNEEISDRKNARIIDKVMIALPRELSTKQRINLVKSFVGEITQGRMPWLCAIHQTGEDTENPHAHLIFRDRDIDTGKRVVGFSERGSTERIRVLWQDKANEALKEAGFAQTIDHRSNKARGIEVPPQIHEGVNAHNMREQGKPIRKQSRRDYAQIDHGRTRAEYNAEIIQLQTYQKPTLEQQQKIIIAQISALENNIDGLEFSLANLGNLPEELVARLRARAEKFISKILFKKQYEKHQYTLKLEELAIKEKLERYKQQKEYYQAQQAQIKDEKIMREHHFSFLRQMQAMTWPPPSQPIKIETPPQHHYAVNAHKATVRGMDNATLEEAILRRPTSYKAENAFSDLSRGAETIKEALRRSKAQSRPEMKQKASQGFKSAAKAEAKQEKSKRKRRRRKR